MATPRQQIMSSLGLNTQQEREEKDLVDMGIPVGQGSPALDQSDPDNLSAIMSIQQTAQESQAPLQQSDPDALAALQMSLYQNKEDEFTTELADDIEGFSMSSFLDEADHLAGYINKGLVGNFLDLPGTIFNVLTFADADDFRYVQPFSKNFLGLNTGAIFDPAQSRGSEEMKKRLRPYGKAAEFASGGFLPQGILNKAAQGMQATRIRTAPFTGGKQQAVAPTSVVRQPLPVASRTPGGTPVQQLTGPGADRITEMVGGFAGLGAGTMSYLSDGDPLAETLGGLTLPLAAILGLKVGSGAYTAYAARKELGGAGDPTGSRALDTAVDQISTQAVDPSKAILTIKKNLAAGKTGDLGVLSEDLGLMSYVKLMRSKGSPSKSTDGFQAKMLEIDEKTSRSILSALDDVTEDTADAMFANFVMGREQAIAKSIQGTVDNARLEAKSAMERSGTDLQRTVDEAQSIVQNQMDIAIKESTKGLNALWNKIPNSFVNRKNVESVAKSFLNKAALSTDQEVVAAGKTLDPYFKALLNSAQKGRVPAKELIKFRSNMLKVVRNSKAKSESNESLEFLAQEAQDAVLQILNKSKASVAYRRAADETLLVNDIFKRATIDLSKPDNLAKRMLGVGEGGAERFDAALKASGYNPGLMGAMDDYVRAAFADTAIVTRNGIDVVDPKKAQIFLKKHQSYLSKPQNQQLRAEFEEAARSQVASEKLAGKQSKFTADRKIQSFNTFSEFTDPVRAVNSVLSNKNPEKAIKLLMRQAAKDSSGDAMEGLQRVFVRSLIQKATGQGIPAQEVLEGTVGSLKGVDFYNKSKPTLNILFGNNKDALKNIDDIFKQIKVQQQAKGAPAARLDVVENVALEALQKFVGVRLAPIISRGSGAGALTIAGTASNAMKKFFTEMPRQRAYAIVEELMINPQKYAAHAERVRAAADEVEAIRAVARLMDAFINPALVSPEEAPEEPFTL
jgi:hypothetical protein